MGPLIRERFLWVEDLRKGLVFLLGDSIDPYFEVKQSSDPLTAFLTIALNRRLPKASRPPMRQYIRVFATEGDCEVPRIEIAKDRIVAEVLFKYRHPKDRPRDEQPDSGTG